MLDGFDFQKENRQKDDKNYVNIIDVKYHYIINDEVKLKKQSLAKLMPSKNSTNSLNHLIMRT